MPNLNPWDARTYNPAPTLWSASSNTSWFPIHLNQFPQVGRLHRRGLIMPAMGYRDPRPSEYRRITAS
jgi:hypothetical protein